MNPCPDFETMRQSDNQTGGNGNAQRIAPRRPSRVRVLDDEVKGGGLAPGEYVATVRRDGVMIIGDFELHDLQPGDLEQLGVPVMEIARGTCVVCGCTDGDCRQCIAKTGAPCSWANKDHTLCSACVPRKRRNFTGGLRVARGGA